MAAPLTINLTRAAKATPFDYTVPDSIELEPLSVFGHWDGSGAAGAFRPAIGIYSGAGILIARVFPGAAVDAGDEADVTFAPFLRQDADELGSRVYALGSLILRQAAPLTVPDGVDTRVTFDTEEGPPLGSGAQVEFGVSPANFVRFTELAAGRVYFLRASILWDPTFLGGRQAYFLYNPSGSGGEIITGIPQVPMGKEIDRFIGGADDLMRLETFMPAVTFGAGDVVEVELYVEQSSGAPQTCYGNLEVFGTMPNLAGMEP